MTYVKTRVAKKTVYQHRLEAEAALGHPLPPKAVVHHAATTLVICQDQKYHMLLHHRMRVIGCGGDPNTDSVCCRCQQVKPLAVFLIRPRRGDTCRACMHVLSRAAVDRLNERRKLAGLCIACGLPADGFVRCQPCRAANLAAQRRSKAQETL